MSDLSPTLSDDERTGLEPAFVPKPPAPPIWFEQDAEYNVMKDSRRRQVHRGVIPSGWVTKYHSGEFRTQPVLWTAPGPAMISLIQMIESRKSGYYPHLGFLRRRAPILFDYIDKHWDWFESASSKQIMRLK